MTRKLNETYQFETGIYRPPSEGGSSSLLVRLTRNCPWNKCTFCGMYKTEKFSIRSVDAIKSDIDAIAAICRELKSISKSRGYGGNINRETVFALMERSPGLQGNHGFYMVVEWLQAGGKTAFLQDGNSLIMKTKDLVQVLEYLKTAFPTISRVTSYARSKTIALKTPEQLESIRRAGLSRLHIGLETGDDILLKKIRKGSSSKTQIIAGKKALAAGFQLSEYWMPGLGGKDHWKDHAIGTARVINEINPDYIRSRPFRPMPGSPLFDVCSRGEFDRLSSREVLVELELMVKHLDFTGRVCFDHAGNHWRAKSGGLLFSQSYEGYLFPDQKPRLLSLIREGIDGYS